MDYSQEQFFNMQQYDVPKMPFYMSYPMQNLYLTEMEYERDMERMKELYPRNVKSILEIIEEECDKMEYEGSLMFDEYPDRMMLERLIDKIYDKVSRDGEYQDEQMEMEQYQRRPSGPPSYGPPGPPPFGPPGPPPFGPPRYDLRDLIGVMLNNEMYKRRCRHRRCRRWW
ncbi:MAG: hypothetical protein ACI4ES_06895 [Roseburia sp.]